MCLYGKMTKRQMPMHYLTVVFCLLVPMSSLQAGGWLRSEGEHRYSAHLQVSSADKSWDRDGNEEISSCQSDNRSLTHEYEYGYSYYRTFFGKLSMSSSECGSDKVSGFSDIHLGVRGRLKLYENGHAWEAILIIPSGYDNERSNRLGYGEVGLDLGLYGMHKYSKKSKFTYGGSMRFWVGAPADQLRLKAGWSHKYNKKWSYNAKLEGNFSMGNGELITTPSLTNEFETEFHVIRAELGARRRISQNLGFGVGVFKNIWGRNTSQRSGLYFDVDYVWGRF